MSDPSDAKAFTMALFDGATQPPRDDDTRCQMCGQTAQRMLRFSDYTGLEPLEMRWCETCWSKSLESGKLHNPLQDIGTGNALSPAYLVSELNLTELPLSEALERLYGVCEKIKGGYIRCRGSLDLPLVGPIKIRSQPLSSALDSMLGPIGLKWDICQGVVLIAPSNEDLEVMKRTELTPKAKI
ncbi:MAG TPA: hypothetical protein VM141_07495 [Planctomycetota bacterium]|nr:hypothetical protein [Planctomycetota bacterium]